MHRPSSSGDLNEALVGDLAVLHGRIVEVVKTGLVDGYSRAYEVEFTDAGGIKRRLPVTNTCHEDHASHLFRVISRPADRVLDAMAEAVGHRGTNPLHQLALKTERWMAAPQAGDMYSIDYPFSWMVVDAVDGDQISTRQSVCFNVNSGWSWKTIVYDSSELFRGAYAHPERPHYRLLAFSSRRAVDGPPIFPSDK